MRENNVGLGMVNDAKGSRKFSFYYASNENKMKGIDDDKMEFAFDANRIYHIAFVMRDKSS